MPEPTCLFLGHCDFDTPALARLAAADGPAAPWQRALADGATAAQTVAAAARGEFAVGVRDATGRAFLAVDRFAVRTLCYVVRDGALYFAERADQLARGADLDPQALFDYLYFHAIPSPRTVWRGVHRLPPGHCAWFEDGRLTVAPYWTPRFDEERKPSFDTLRDAFRGHLKAAVTRQLDGSKPACFLSGGTDSSTVAGMIGEAAGRPAASYSIGFEAAGYDEMAYARIAAQRFGCEHHEYYVTPDDLVRSIAQVAAHHDQPFGNSSALPAYYCALRAREDGVTKLLAGDGGDELFGGNSRYAKQRVFGWYAQLPAGVRTAILEPVFGQALVARAPGLKKGSSYIEQARVEMPDRLQMYNLLLRLGTADVLTPAFLGQVDTQGPARQQRAVWAQVHETTAINRMLAFDWRYTLAESDLPKVRGSTRLAGVEVGFPFLDKALVDFSLSLPSHYKLKGLKLRWFFKEALRGFLPDQIITKRKQGFGLPFGVWANRHAALHELAADSLHSLAQRGVVQPAFIRTLLQTLLPAHPGYYGEMVWILMMMEQWLQHHAPDWRIA
jgi:asparagine synthase (glutamine-hydrolysing)